MMQTLRAEFCKLLTIRSTYVVSILLLLLIGFISFWGVGVKGGPVFSPTTLTEVILNATMITGTIAGILAILHICHEYRYNTITYSLTISNSRFKVLVAKFVVVSVLAVVLTFLTAVVAMSMPGLGASVAGHSLGTQTIDAWNIAWRVFTFVLGSAWLGLILGFLVRSVVAATVIFLMLPAIESLLHALLKISNNYLPAASQMQILQTPDPASFSPLASLGVFAVYLAASSVVATVLFVRRDATS